LPGPLAGLRPGPWPGLGAAGVPRGLGGCHAAEAPWRAVRVRSTSTAVVAATRAAASVIRVICQPVIPPATMMRVTV
jgi:hypothetical protein